MEFSVGVGLTNACDLACAHCYRDVDRIDQLTHAQVLSVCDCLPVRSINLGTGENGLHPDYAAIVGSLAARGVKLSLTSNGYTVEHSPDETLRAFREIEVSIDFPIESEQDAFRGAGNWKRVMASIEPKGSWMRRSSGTQRVTGSSSASRPRSRSCMTATAVSVLVIDP